MSTSLASYRTLGRSGLRVSPLCLGTMTFGMDWKTGCEPAEAHRLMDAYASQGGNFLDTANIYTKGHSEAIIGDYFAERGGRDRWVVATKFCGNLYPGDPNAGGAGRKSILRNLEESLRRLRTDHVDLYWMHFNDAHTPVDETLRTLDDLVSAGKIRYIGFSDTPAWRCAEAQVLARVRGWHPLVALQIEYSLIERTVEFELLPMARAFGLGVTPWAPLRGGLLSGKYGKDRIPEGGRHKVGVSKSLTDRNFDIIRVLQAVAEEVGQPPAAVALAWLLQRPGVVSPILGARQVEQLTENLVCLGTALSPEQMARLDDASAPKAIFPNTLFPELPTLMQGGTEVNGVPGKPWPMAPASDQERW